MIQTKLPFKENFDFERSFRTLHYLGGKSRIIEPLRKILNEINVKGGICDLFAGSGAVSQAFCSERKVIANDIQEYSRVICSALLNPNTELVSENGINSLNCIDELVLYKGLTKFKELINLEERVLRNQEFSKEEIAQFIEGSSIYKWLNNEIPKKAFPQLKKAMNQTLLKIAKSNKKEFLITQYFGGVFFSFKQSCYLDAIHAQIQKLDNPFYDTHLAALLSCASNIVNTVGKQFAQPINPRNKDGIPKKNLIQSLNKDRNIDVMKNYKECLQKYLNKKNNNNFHHLAIKMDFREAIGRLDDDIKFIYADPPYTRDHYSRFYHVLETICFNDYPKVSKNKAKGVVNYSKGLYREIRHQSEFCIRSQAPNAFNDLFKLSRENNKVLILSYSPYDESKGAHPRVVKLDYLQSQAKKYFESVNIVSAGKFRHSKLNKVGLHLSSENEAEIFLVCKKKM